MKRNKRQVQQYSRAISILMIFFLVTVGAVYCGYLGTKHIILPFFLEKEDGRIAVGVAEEKKDASQEVTLGETQGLGNEINSAEQVQKIEKETVEEKIRLYTLKFGTYSTEENGNRAVEDLAKKSIFSYPVSVEGEYRIYSLPFCEKEDATAFKEGYLAMGEDCFVVPRSFSLKDGFSSEFMKNYIDILKDVSYGIATGVQRQQLALELLSELKMAYGNGNGAISDLITKVSEEVALISGTDNEILFELQKTIIMNMALAFR